MVKHTQTIRRWKPTNCLSMPDHFTGLALKRFSSVQIYSSGGKLDNNYLLDNNFKKTQPKLYVLGNALLFIFFLPKTDIEFLLDWWTLKQRNTYSKPT